MIVQNVMVEEQLEAGLLGRVGCSAGCRRVLQAAGQPPIVFGCEVGRDQVLLKLADYAELFAADSAGFSGA